MNTQVVINEINLLRAHASEILKIADRLTHRIGTAGVFTPAPPRKRGGLSDEQKAKFLAKKNRNKK